MSGFHPKDLIHEVKIRPGIYNREVLEHPPREHKRRLWLEVAERLTPPEDWETFTDVEKDVRVGEIATKWKNLKDHFYREIKLIEAGEANKKRKYIYYDDMEFIRPFVGYKMPSINKRVTTQESLDDTPEFLGTDTEIDMEAFLNGSDNVEDQDSKVVIINGMEQGQDITETVIKLSPSDMQNMPSSSNPKQNHTQKETVIKNFDVLKKTGGGASNSSFKIRDGDITFCLSLVPTLRKLGDARKLRAKIEILKILHFYVDHIERHNLSNRPNVSNNTATTNNINQSEDVEEGMTEDYLEEYDDNINVKREQFDDPLHGGGSGNTKIWWT